MSQTDAESRHAGIQEFSDRLDCVVAGLGIARAVRQEYTVGFERQRFFGRSLRRQHGELAAPAREHAQDVVLHAVVIGDDVIFRRCRCPVPCAQRPLGLIPLIGLVATDHFREVHAGQAGEGARLPKRKGFVDLASHQAATLRAFVAQDAGEFAGIDSGNRRDVLIAQVTGQVLAHAEIARADRQIADDQSGGEDLVRLGVFRIDADIADVRIGQRDDLPAIRRIGQDFLIAGHRGVEHHFTGCMGLRADRIPAEYRAVGEHEYGGLTVEGRQERLPEMRFQRYTWKAGEAHAPPAFIWSAIIDERRRSFNAPRLIGARSLGVRLISTRARPACRTGRTFCRTDSVPRAMRPAQRSRGWRPCA